MNHWLHPEAELEFELVIDRYLTRFGLAAAQRLLNEYERVRTFVVHNPALGTKPTRGRRLYPFKAMPYLLIYRADEGGVDTLIVRHQHRNPRLGAHRN